MHPAGARLSAAVTRRAREARAAAAEEAERFEAERAPPAWSPSSPPPSASARPLAPPWPEEEYVDAGAAPRRHSGDLSDDSDLY